MLKHTRNNLIKLILAVTFVGFACLVSFGLVQALGQSSESAKELDASIIIRKLRDQNTLLRAATGAYAQSPSALRFDGQWPQNPFDPDATTVFEIDVTPGRKHPLVRTINSAGAFWYNPTNGALRVRVSRAAINEQTRKRYNAANMCEITFLDQTN